MFTAIGTFFYSLFAPIGQLLGKAIASAAPQRADFEAVNTSWKDLALSLKGRMDEMDKEYKRNRRHDQKRIEDLEAEAEECRKFRAEDSIAMDRLRSQVRLLQEEVLSLKAGT